MDQKAVALQLRKLAADPDNQAYIVKEKGCMKGLMGFLESPQEEVIVISLQALQFLSQHPANKESLSNEPGLLAKLALLTDHDNDNVNRISADILKNLEEFVNGPKKPVKKEVPAPPTVSSAMPTTPFKPRHLYNIPLQIKELRTSMDGEKVKTVLLMVKGVVSITTEVDQRQVTVYSKIPEKDIAPFLIAAVKGVDMTATIVAAPAPKPKAVNNENVPKSSNVPNPGYAVPANGPKYLSANTLHEDGSTALTEYKTTLEARLKKQQEKSGQQKGWFGAVTSYFW